MGAGAGIAQQLLWPGAPKIIATGVYIALGWIIVPHVGEVRYVHRMDGAFRPACKPLSCLYQLEAMEGQPCTYTNAMRKNVWKDKVLLLQMGDALGSMGSNLVILGGIAYSIGGMIYALRWPDPSPKVRLHGRHMHRAQALRLVLLLVHNACKL